MSTHVDSIHHGFHESHPLVGFHQWGIPKIDGLFHGKSQAKTDDWG